ncbi:hypothetical protein TTRE_0000484601 [Trichuris trichiura]|uniref:Uncharacterized protein n=1 Tax=Trichuris trichiura TaxID=36087 RepID=A0A077Z8N5_TRITR|nr:hypothetical protein TTRE_0000484601 [Trichuris trichiura]
MLLNNSLVKAQHQQVALVENRAADLHDTVMTSNGRLLDPLEYLVPRMLSSMNLWASLAWIKCLCLEMNLGLLRPLLQSLLLEYDVNTECHLPDYQMQRNARSTYPKFWHHISNGLWPLGQIESSEREESKEEIEPIGAVGSTVCWQMPTQIVQAIWFMCVIISCILLLIGVKLVLFLRRSCATEWSSRIEHMKEFLS